MTGTTLPHSGIQPGRAPRRRERLVTRWRHSTLLVGVVALIAVGAVLTAAFTLGGFGVPTDASPQQISAGAIPYGLLNKTSPRQPVVNPNHKEHTEQVVVYFMGASNGQSNGHLKGVLALIQPPVSIAATLNALLSPPGTTGGEAGVQTAIPVGTQLLSSSLSASLATVNLSSQIFGAGGQQLIQAFAQIVYTVTNSDKCIPPSRQATTTTTSTPKPSVAPHCVDRVLFEVGGQPLEVPIGSGAETSKPITRVDYRQLAPVS